MAVYGEQHGKYIETIVESTILQVALPIELVGFAMDQAKEYDMNPHVLLTLYVILGIDAVDHGMTKEDALELIRRNQRR